MKTNPSENCEPVISVNDEQWGWPLFGAGLENLGQDGQLTALPVAHPGPEQLLMRVDAVSLCFSDVKVIRMGSQHPRLVGRDLGANPILPGHEASLTVISVGEALQHTYRVGQRFTVQPDVWFEGKSTPFGYDLEGAYQQYVLIGKQILDGDAGNYLIPVPPDMTHVAAALTEPWACVEASYRAVYRTTVKPGGAAWFLGGTATRQGYSIDRIWDPERAPAHVVITELPDDLESNLRDLCCLSGTEIIKRGCGRVLESGLLFEDIFVLDGDFDAVDSAALCLSKGGVLAMARAEPMSGPIQMDLGRLHYDHIIYVGCTETDLDKAYQGTPARTALMPQGVTWIVGSGGPMGRMHLQRAIEIKEAPRRIVATDLSQDRCRDLEESFVCLAEQQSVQLTVLNPGDDKQIFHQFMDTVVAEGGINDVEVMASVPIAVEGVIPYLAVGGVVNLFAGLKRGSMMPLDPWLIFGPMQIRLVGHSGSALDDQKAVVDKAVAGDLVPERSMVALAGLRQIPDGVDAMANASFPGKIVVFPAVLDFPLTALSELESVLPEAYAGLAQGKTWTSESETAFLQAMLPD